MSEDWIVGINPVAGALGQDTVHVCAVLVERGTRNRRVRHLVEQAQSLQIPVHQHTREELATLSGVARHQGIVARAEGGGAVMREADLAALLERRWSRIVIPSIGWYYRSTQSWCLFA